ncbi:hypothetical protein GGR50DRAFT_706856 [Xylaria sp. CBS 124048]|nr:hypothetical protein GGR50DRAFT_706856 [Xylaria sp. CBS 124048]
MQSFCLYRTEEECKELFRLNWESSLEAIRGCLPGQQYFRRVPRPNSFVKISLTFLGLVVDSTRGIHLHRVSDSRTSAKYGHIPLVHITLAPCYEFNPTGHDQVCLLNCFNNLRIKYGPQFCLQITFGDRRDTVWHYPDIIWLVVGEEGFNVKRPFLTTDRRSLANWWRDEFESTGQRAFAKPTLQSTQPQQLVATSPKYAPEYGVRCVVSAAPAIIRYLSTDYEKARFPRIYMVIDGMGSRLFVPPYMAEESPDEEPIPSIEVGEETVRKEVFL